MSDSEEEFGKSELETKKDETNEIYPTVPTDVLIYVHHGDCLDGMQILTLAHPKSKVEMKFALLGGRLLEIQKRKAPFAAWLINNTVAEDGSLFVATAVDPLFFLLPVLVEKISTQYRTASDLLHGYEVLSRLVSDSHLRTVCDVETVDDTVLYRLSQDMILAWLRIKVKRLLSCPALVGRCERVAPPLLGSADAMGADGADAERRRAGVVKEHVLLLALGMVGEWIPTAVFERLQQSFGIVPQQLDKKSSSSSSAAFKEETAARKAQLGAKRKAELEKEKEAKRHTSSRNVALLASQKPKGMKTMTAFFSKKT
eukprot:NODE_1193_length_1047_cov_266.195391_g915_i0.p1 GENE.NODE_1193_length_1047_cov_266.195391_g915_i0~~NODE_1193_length_1047_cov_266.195391_g915_i0.p1  ORF type:complete len:314 (+),score=84.46 NODE_1193_length_1047_cov_266.195391_g915_i0:90-1031(+)